MHSDRISIIIPVYNGEETLEKCVWSVSDQTYDNLEIIIVNDGSSDMTGQICGNLAAQDSRIVVLTQENAGVSSARNNGLNHMHGSYVMFLDADDFMDLDTVQAAYDTIQKLGRTRSSVIIPAVIEKPDGTVLSYSSVPEERLLGRCEMAEHYGDRDNAMYLRVWGKLFTSDVFRTLRFTEDALYEDMLIFPSILYHVDQTIVMDRCLYHYVQSEESITRRKKTELDFQSVEAALHIFDSFCSWTAASWTSIRVQQGAEDKIYAKMKGLKQELGRNYCKKSKMFQYYLKEYRKRLGYLRSRNASSVKRELRALALAM